VPDVQEFLGRCRTKLGNRVEEYQRVVAENDVDGEVLIEMNEDGLQTLGIKSFGHRFNRLPSSWVVAIVRYFELVSCCAHPHPQSYSHTNTDKHTHTHTYTCKHTHAHTRTYTYAHRMFICKMLRHYTSSAIRGDTSDTGSAVGSSDSTVRRNEHQSNGQDLDLPRGDVVEERFHFTPVSLTAPRRQASFAFAGDGYGHARAETDGNFRDQDRVRERGMEETGNLAVSRPVEPRMQKATPRIHESKIQIRNKIGTGSVATVYAGEQRQWHTFPGARQSAGACARCCKAPEPAARDRGRTARLHCNTPVFTVLNTFFEIGRLRCDATSDKCCPISDPNFVRSQKKWEIGDNTTNTMRGGPEAVSG